MAFRALGALVYVSFPAARRRGAPGRAAGGTGGKDRMPLGTPSAVTMLQKTTPD